MALVPRAAALPRAPRQRVTAAAARKQFRTNGGQGQNTFVGTPLQGFGMFAS